METLEANYSQESLDKITNVVGNFLYELNVDHEEADMEGERLVRHLLESGFRIVEVGHE